MEEETKHGFIEEYFADMPIEKLTNGEYTKVVEWRKNIYLSKIEDDKEVKGLCVGKVFSVSKAESFKSRSYPDIEDIIFEEFITNGLYVRNEVNMLMVLVSTIFRKRKGKVFLIGNTLSRQCPYFNEWQLTNVPKMEIGQIDIYKYNDEDTTTTIAVEYCGNANIKNSGMFFGNLKKSIDSGAWEVKNYPHLPNDYTCYDLIYQIGLYSKGYAFIIDVIFNKKTYNKLLFIKPASENKERQFGYRLPNRVLTDEFSEDRNHTPYLKDIKIERCVGRLWYDKKVCYAHNLCGADFENTLKNMNCKPF